MDPKQMTRPEAIRRIARETGYSESSIHKILSNPIGFSEAAVEAVRRAAEACGLSVEPARPELPALPTAPDGRRTLRVGVLIPGRPLYFWREAVLGMEKSRARLEAERGVSVRLIYHYHGYRLDEAESARTFSELEAEPLDGFILYPVGGAVCRHFLEHTDKPTLLFNDTQDYMTDAWFSAHPHLGSVGPDCADEGRRAAELLLECAARRGDTAPTHIAAICPHQVYGAVAPRIRVRGLCERLATLSPPVRVSHMELDPTERIASSTLARRLAETYGEDVPDALYISSGVTHLVSAALEKLERRRGTPLPTFVIGHECASADRRYLLEGRQRGYIKQDVYTQGLVAVSDLLATLLDGTPLARRVERSSVFVR